MAKDETPLSVVKDEIQKGLRAFKAFEHGEKILAALEGLEQNEKELGKSIDAKKAEIEMLDAELKQDKAAITDAKAQAEKIVADAKDKATGILLKAETDGEEIVSQVNAEKDKISAAIKAAATQLSKTNSEIDNKQAELTKLTDAVDKQKSALAGALSNLG